MRGGGSLKGILLKIGLVLAGYAAALGLAVAAVYLESIVSQAVRGQNSQGMVAEGDSILFLAVFGFVSLFPTGLGLYFLRPYPRFWTIFSYVALVLAVTGPLAEAMNTSLRILQVFQSPWDIASFFGLARVFGAPILAAGFFATAWIAPDWKSRWKFLAACGIEAALCFYVAFVFIFWKRLF